MVVMSTVRMKRHGRAQNASHGETHFPAGNAPHRETFQLFRIVQRSAYGGKALLFRDDHVVVAVGAVDNQDIAVLVPAAHDANVGVLRVEYQIARLGLGPCNRCTVGVLGAGTPAVAYGVGPIGDVVKYPVYKTGTVEAIGKICSAGGAASRPNLLDRPPAAVPANYPAFAAPKVVDLPHQLTGCFHSGAALRGQIGGEVPQHVPGLLL